MTIGDLITDVKQSTRQNSTELDAFLLSAAGRIYRRYLRNDNWPQQRVTGTTLSIVAGTQSYDLPADFDRFSGDRVNYTYLSGVPWNSILLPIVLRGTTNGDRLISVWEGINYLNTSPSCSPSIVAVSPGGANTYQLTTYPSGAGATGDTLSLDYYSVPSSVASDTVVIQPLYETLVASLSKEKSRFLNDEQNLSIFAQREREEYRTARMTLSSL